jgi:hypothetical protein
MSLSFCNIFSSSESALTLVSVIVGFILAVIWQLIFTHITDKRRHSSGLKRVVSEIKLNISLIDKNIELLNIDINAAKDRKVLRTPLNALDISAFGSAYFQGNLKINRLDNAPDLLNVYDRIKLINHFINSRDLFIHTNAAMTNFSDTRKIINNHLLELLMTARGQLTQISGLSKEQK